MIKKWLRRQVDKYVSRVFVDAQPYKSFVDIQKLPHGYYKSFGQKNPSKIFYVIWLDHRGSGFFSNFSSVLCHLKIAKENSLIPVIDFQNFPTLYNEKSKINQTANSWEYYFTPVSQSTLQEVYQSKHVFFSSGLYPRGMSYSITENPGLYQIFQKNISLQPDVKAKIASFTGKINFNQALGIHFRGQEQKYATGHSFPPTEAQMFRYTDAIMAKYHLNKIFLVTEDSEYLKIFIRRYGDQVIYSDMFRTHGVNAYKLRPRPNHMYLLGREVLVDAYLLARCRGLLCGDSNVSEIARFINHGKYRVIYKIDNGINSSNPLIARHLYGLKKALPSQYGGLTDKLTIIETK